MSYPTPMDIAESEDRDADLPPSERLANICAALEEDLSESPFTREEWTRLDTERRELLAANDALAEQLADAERILGVAADAIEERCSGLTGDPLQPIADLIGDYYRGREAAPTWPEPFGARGHRGASCACHMDVGQWRTDCPLHGFQRTTSTVEPASASVCLRYHGTGAIDTATSADDPSCPDCDGEGVRQ